jgi:hypothetical protein
MTVEYDYGTGKGYKADYWDYPYPPDTSGCGEWAEKCS